MIRIIFKEHKFLAITLSVFFILLTIAAIFYLLVFPVICFNKYIEFRDIMDEENASIWIKRLIIPCIIDFYIFVYIPVSKWCDTVNWGPLPF